MLHTSLAASVRWFLVVLGGLAVALPAQAAIPIQHWTHASGARVYLVASPAIPMLDVQIDMDGGSLRDPPSRAGLASATASLMSAGVAAHQGQPALDENQLSEAWVDLGAQMGAQAGGDRLSVSLRSLTEPDLLEGAVALAARQLAAPAWPDAIWQRERQRWLASMKEAETRPGTHAGRAFSQAVYRDHPYGREVTATTVGTITVDHMRAFYRRHAAACRAQVSLVGAIDRATAERIVDRFMAALATNGCEPLSRVTPVVPLAQAVERRLPFDAAQAQVLVGQPGHRRNDPDFFPLFVGNYILGGGGFVSRLTTEVREKRGLSYSAYSYFSPGLHGGTFQVGLTTRPDQAEQALGVAREVVKRFVDEGPTDAELQAAKDYLVNGFALRIDSNRKLLDNVANIAWNGLPLDYLDTWTARVQSVTVADIRRAFARVLQPDRMVTVVVGGAR
ncbi:MAG: insulinase family protein [Hydrogenophaga sp.]|uniref:M16 family metallopeptidase n=1 Tax=Hydrogenophaga sp. TaxID=1904254 RepID=UPI0025C4524B|nr:pitrilysin family protein [Hydrogenophaga sp.]MBT9553643.1 insulinase family protein [Hydrogenophaga sp.]